MLIAEDQLLVREGLVNVLGAGGLEVIGTVDTGEAILPAVRESRPDLALLDIRLPPTGSDEGLRAAVAIRAEMPGQPVALLSQYVELLYVEELLSDETGALGYLLKDRVFSPARFIEDLETVAAGGTVIDPAIVAGLIRRRKHRTRLDRLTPRERQALELMAQGRSNRAIADEMVITEKAVAKLVGGILAKLELLPQDPSTSRRVLAVLAYLRS
ncbi:response regulator [Microlunatus sp. Gsoil 973]|uniref:response regulator transcription factor n=1 Tax=Microlunatus sp. Gsoil 973 TaxID=2672569 RepID=UPI00351AC06C